MKLGEKLAALASADAERGNGFSASSKYLRAANYFLIAERIASWTDSRRLNTYGLALQAFQKGLTLSGAKVERVEVPYEGATLSGWLRLPDKATRSPAIVFYNGFDSIKEMHYLMFAGIAARRGIATLFADQEGTGEAIRYHRLAKRHDTEVSAGLYFDALAAHPAIDSDRIGIVGLSMAAIARPERRRSILASNASGASAHSTSWTKTGNGFCRVDWRAPYRMACRKAVVMPCGSRGRRRSAMLLQP
jgi:hypothetical protein